MAATKYLESTVATWVGGIWAHRNSSWCSSDVVIRVCNLGYVGNQKRLRDLWASLCSRSLASRSYSSTCQRSSLINIRPAMTPEVFGGFASSRGCTLDSLDHFIQLNKDIVPISPVKLKKIFVFLGH